MNVFKTVKDAVSPMDAARLYGLKINRGGMCLCPFHNDKHPSMKVDMRIGGGFYCFGCHESGDVITLTSKLLGLGPKEAAFRLAEDFNLNIDDDRNESNHVTYPEEIRKRQEAEERRKFAVRKRDLCRYILDKLSDIREEKWNCEAEAMKVLEGNDTYTWIIHHIDRLDDCYEFLISNTDEEIHKNIDSIEREVKENVREFENKCRRG